ncbi:MAG: hypothetical protein RLZZ488_1129 [Pseudomonadota bacterium]|jgi:tRNA pseudouridine38-40 synthase
MNSEKNLNASEHESPLIERFEAARGVRFRAREGVRNICLEISYRGDGFMGYQSQPHGNTVQDTLSRAWQTLTQETPTLYGCSRLDAGVHAQQFFLNVFSRTNRSNEDITRSLNGILRSGMQANVSVYRCFDAGPDFNARFDTLGKHYRYRLWYGRGHHAQLTPAAWAVRSRDFSIETLRRTLQQCVGEFDFSAFRASDCTAKSTVRRIHKVEVGQDQLYPEAVFLDFWGEGFLKNMIRNLVGTGVEIATQKLSADALTAAFTHKDRTRVGQCAPAHALSLERVFYQQADWLRATGFSKVEFT